MNAPVSSGPFTDPADPEHNREDLQPQLIDKVVPHQGVDEPEVGRDDDGPSWPDVFSPSALCTGFRGSLPGIAG
jgi:hypothetical protein